jgi:hypothetical protein
MGFNLAFTVLKDSLQNFSDTKILRSGCVDGLGVNLGALLNLSIQCNEKSASCSGSFNPQSKTRGKLPTGDGPQM